MNITIDVEGEFEREVMRRITKKICDELTSNANYIESFEAKHVPETENYEIKVVTWTIESRHKETRADLERTIRELNARLDSMS